MKCLGWVQHLMKPPAVPAIQNMNRPFRLMLIDDKYADCLLRAVVNSAVPRSIL